MSSRKPQWWIKVDKEKNISMDIYKFIYADTNDKTDLYVHIYMLACVSIQI